MSVKNPPNQQVIQLRRLEDYAIRSERRALGLGDLRKLNAYDDEQRDPIEILNEIISDPAKEKDKQQLIDLIHEEVTMINQMTEGFDNRKLSLYSFWGKIMEVVMKLKHFFVDLKDTSEEGLEKFSGMLEKVINHLKPLRPSKFFKSPDTKNLKSLGADSQRIIQALCVLVNKNESKRAKLSEAVGHIRSIEEEHRCNRIQPVADLVKKLIDVSELESRIYACIGRLVNIKEPLMDFEVVDPKNFILRNLADYMAAKLRQRPQFWIERISDYEDETRDAETILNQIFPDTTKSDLKKSFLEIAEERAKKMLSITAEIDSRSEVGVLLRKSLYVSIESIWKNLKFFFLDLIDKSQANVERFSSDLKSAIVYLNILYRSCRFAPDADYSFLDQDRNAKKILQKEQFIEDDRFMDKKQRLAKVMFHIKESLNMFKQLGLKTPNRFIQNLVEVSEIESKLHACIDRLVAA